MNKLIGTSLVAAVATVGLSACGATDPATNGVPKVDTTPVVVMNVPGDKDELLKEFTFTDKEGVKQKCFAMGSTRGSISCQPVEK